MITIIDYGLGNLGSIKNMLKRIGIESVITSEHKIIEVAEKIILPGVGNFGKGMEEINKRGLTDILNKKALEDKIPILGICLGMQLITEWSEECDCKGLGWITGKTVRFRFDNNLLKIPHMGWNIVKTDIKRNHLINEDSEQRFYFVHSFYVKTTHKKNSLGTTVYGHEFNSIIGDGNIYGVQFHPEKSHSFGMKLLKNFNEI